MRTAWLWQRSYNIFCRGKFVPCVTEGKGADVFMLHGYGSRKESFYYQIKFLSEHFRVTVPDMPGFGASEALSAAWSVGDYADWVREFICCAKLEKPHIIAHSFGARVALKLLSERADIAEKLVITGGAGLVKPRSKAYIRRVNAYRRVKKLFPKYAEKRFGSEEYKKLSPIMKESYKKIVNEDLRGCAAKITNRTLLLYGSEDTVTPVGEEGAIFHSLIAESKLEVIRGGHFCFTENAAEFNGKVLGFLTD